MANKRNKRSNHSTNKNLYYITGGILLFAVAVVYFFFLGKPSNPSKSLTYNATVQPVLQQKCVGCHNPTGRASGKPLDSYTNVKNFIVPGNSAKSRLVQAVDGGSMSGILTGAEVDSLKKWVNQGAKEQ